LWRNETSETEERVLRSRKVSSAGS
jgi:hypothetical protein